jgi:hypothetical protein
MRHRSPPRARNEKGQFLYRHGQHHTPLYNVWTHMLNRCVSPADKRYTRYGGRGIRVCLAWHDSAVFIAWAHTNGYREGLQIDRRDNEGDYTPENCRFVTCETNNNNRRDNRRVSAFGEVKTVAEWSRDERCVVRTATLRRRLKVGWPPIPALTLPLRAGRGFRHRTGEASAHVV